MNTRGLTGKLGGLRLPAALLGAVVLMLLGQASARGGASGDPRPIPPPPLAGVPALPGPIAPAATPAADGEGILVTAPDSGPVGSGFTVSGNGLPKNADVDLVWGTWRGAYVMNPAIETVQFFERRFEPVRVVLGHARTDADGRISAKLKAPEDYGEFHDVTVVANGVELGKGRFRLARTVTLTPRRGPVGRLITVKVTGLGWKPYESTMAVRYDNKYTGFISATTTRGTATAQLRAAGPVGRHVIELDGASNSVPYLNIEQSPVYYIAKSAFVFNVTEDAGAPRPRTDWPAAVSPTESRLTTVADGASFAPGVSVKLSPESGPIKTSEQLSASGLEPGASVGLVWVTAVGNRVSPSGWSLKDIPVGSGTVGADGRVAATFSVPDDLGGWHALKVIQAGKVAAEIPYFVERSLATLTPRTVKAGHTFRVTLKGVGWTELDNGAAVTYDNAFIGYGCGFNSQGDLTMNLVATGGPGTHLIDVYPMIYQGAGKPPWSYQVPILAFKQDAPGLALGYRLPAFRLAIRVVK